MDFPKVKKHFSDLLPKARAIGAGILMAAIGTITPGQPAQPAADSSSIAGQKDQPFGKLVMQQSNAPSTMHAQHWSHSSHSSHYSHSSHHSHYSHYSSR